MPVVQAAEVTTIVTLSPKMPDFWVSDPGIPSGEGPVSLSQDYSILQRPSLIHTYEFASLHDVTRAASPVDDLYKTVKASLTRMLDKTKWLLIFSQMDHRNFSDHMVSVVMNEMLALLPEDEQPVSLFLRFFIQCLSKNMLGHMAAYEFKSPSECAELADHF